MTDTPATSGQDRIRIENVNHPGKTTPVDARMYHAMRTALLAVLPDSPPGLTEAGMREAVKPALPADLFPGGERASWWSKAVQLDLEAKGEVVREHTRPLRWHRPETVSRPSEVQTFRDGGSRGPRHGGARGPAGPGPAG